jgi:hypothetical protein
VTKLVVFYDPRCGLCCAVRDWIARQRQIVPVECRPKADGPAGGDDLLVVADSGELWSGDTAWLMVFWALADYRAWSHRLASPLLLPTARALFARISRYRGALSCSMGLTPEVPPR